MRKRYFLAVMLLGCVSVCQAQYTDIHDFNGSGGKSTQSTLLAVGNKLYGTTAHGGANNYGCIFSIDTTGGGFKDIFDFNSTNGAFPGMGKLVMSKGLLFGMTYSGGANNKGCIFSIDTNGTKYKDILDFNGTNGADPYGSVILMRNVLYGMTYSGGAHGDGLVFSIDSTGAGYNDLHDFSGSDGQNPAGTLTPLRNKLYGMTLYGGAQGNGCIFCMDSNGAAYKDMLDFNDQNPPYGANPYGEVVISGAMMFGFTSAGGVPDFGCAFSMDTTGAGYKDIKDFNAGAVGYFPYGDPVLIGKVVYGTVANGAANNGGGIFSLDSNGTNYSVIYNFSAATGETSESSLTLDSNSFYGTALAGGSNSDGVIFKFNYHVTGVNEIKVENNATLLFPNPNNGVFTIEIKNQELNMKNIVEIYNALGQKVYSTDNAVTSFKNSLLTVSLTDKPAGIYMYRIVGQDGSLIATGKFVMQ